MADDAPLEVFDPIRKFMTNGQGQMRVYADRVEIDRKKETRTLYWSQVTGFAIHNKNGAPFQLGFELDLEQVELTRKERLFVKTGGQAVGFLNGIYSKDLEGLATKLAGYHAAWHASQSGE